MALASLSRIAALLSVVLLLSAGTAEAAHHEEEDCALHGCAICAAGSLAPLISARGAPHACPPAARSLPPGPQRLPLCSPYRDCLPSRAPPAAA